MTRHRPSRRGLRSRTTLGRVRRRGLADPGAVLVRTTPVVHARLVGRTVALDALDHLGDVDRSEVVAAALGVPGELRVGEGEPERPGLRPRHVDETLPQV